MFAGVTVGIVAAVAGLTADIPVPRGRESFRCGVWLIEIGESRDSVQSACGEPAERVFLKRTFRDRYGRKKMTIEEEVWTYDLGPTVLTRVLVLSKGLVNSIATGKHGKNR